MSTVDVVVPCYKYGHYLRECVTSVLAQSGPAVRVLIIDDASPDDTFEIATELARSDSRVCVRRHAGNKGHIATFNEGIEWASADYMLLLSADDYLLPGALSRAAALMDTHRHVGFTFGKAAGGTATGLVREDRLAGRRRSEHDVEVLSGEHFLRVSGSHAIVPTPAAVVRTELQKRVGGYRPELPHTGDMEMWYRFAAHACVGVLGAFQAVYRIHGENMSFAYFTKHRLPDLQERRSAIEWFFRNDGTRLPNARELHQLMVRSLALDAASHASAAFNQGSFEASDALASYALMLAPDVKYSVPWVKLQCKRRLGPQGWRALAPALRRIRGVSTLARDRFR